jgi:hypothetical protein
VDVVVAARNRRHQRILVVSSVLMVDAVRSVFDSIVSRLEGAPTVDLIVPEARFFGGDILLGDLLVFEDILRAVLAKEASDGSYDEVVVPATMCENGIDLIGKRFAWFDAELGGRVRLSRHPRILD